MRRTRSKRSTTRPSEVERAFASIGEDRTHGARELSIRALVVISRLLDRWKRSPPPRLDLAFRSIAINLESAQPAMGPFLGWSGDWVGMARRTRNGDSLRAARAWVRAQRAGLSHERRGLVRTSRRRFPSSARRVVTLSRSQTVLWVLSRVPGHPPVSVTVLESLPGGEGKLFAKDLRHAGVVARVVPDRSRWAAVRTADLVLVGADAVLPDGSVIHKVGTLSLARTAHRWGVPVVVVAGRSKFLDRPAPRRRWPPLFDRTPSDLVSEYWTDHGSVPGGRSTGSLVRRDCAENDPG